MAYLTTPGQPAPGTSMTPPQGGGLGPLLAIFQGLKNMIPQISAMDPAALGALGGDALTGGGLGLPEMSMPDIPGVPSFMKRLLPQGTPAENLLTVPGAVNYGFQQGSENPAALPTSIMDINQRIGGAVLDTLPHINPILGLMHSLQALDAGNNPAEATPTGLPPLSHDQMMQELGYAPPPAADPNSGGLQVQAPAPLHFDPPPEMDIEQLQGANRNSILGALAQGAAGVDPTSPGSFARALAGAGGAGASMAGEAQARNVDIAHKNAMAAYEVSMKNKTHEYEMMLPNIKATDDSVVIQEYDPNGNKYNVRVIKTGGVLEDADKLKKYIEAMGLPGPAAEASEVEYMSKILGNDPAALQITLKRMAIERSILNGAGAVVFPEFYEDAAAAVKAELNSQVGLLTDPEAYQKAFAKAMSAKLLSNPAIMASDDWLVNAANYGSVSAKILTGNGGQ